MAMGSCPVIVDPDDVRVLRHDRQIRRLERGPVSMRSQCPVGHVG